MACPCLVERSCDGTPTPGPADSDGAALTLARRRRTHPEAVHPKARGRSEETHLIGLWARARARNETKLMRRRAARAFAVSLLGMRSSQGSDAASPLSEKVVHDHWCAGIG